MPASRHPLLSRRRLSVPLAPTPDTGVVRQRSVPLYPPSAECRATCRPAIRRQTAVLLQPSDGRRLVQSDPSSEPGRRSIPLHVAAGGGPSEVALPAAVHAIVCCAGVSDDRRTATEAARGALPPTARHRQSRPNGAENSPHAAQMAANSRQLHSAPVLHFAA